MRSRFVILFLLVSSSAKLLEQMTRLQGGGKELGSFKAFWRGLDDIQCNKTACCVRPYYDRYKELVYRINGILLRFMTLNDNVLHEDDIVLN